jgi:hypothetical protein
MSYLILLNMITLFILGKEYKSWWWRMASSGMLCHVAVVRTDVSKELSASIIRVRRIGGLGTLAVTSNRHTLVFLRSVRRLLVMANVPSSPILVTLMMEGLSSSETLVPTTATWCNIPDDAILHHQSIFLSQCPGQVWHLYRTQAKIQPCTF